MNGDGSVSPNSHSTPASTTGTVTGTSATESLVYNPHTGTKVVPSHDPFSLTSVSYFTFTGKAGDDANLSNSLDTAAAAPAPAGIMLALTGIPFLGIGTPWLRRRRQAV